MESGDQGSLMGPPKQSDTPDNINQGTEGYEGERLHQLFLGGRSVAGPSIAQQDGAQGSQMGQRSDDINIAEPERPDSFDPLFTVIENTDTGEQHHPHVHYVFSDDDPDILNNALLDTLSGSPLMQTSGRTPGNPVGVPKTERCVVIDMDNTGQGILFAKSLSQDWQVSDVQIAPAPTFDELANDELHGSMLRIIGMRIPQNMSRVPPEEAFIRAQERHGKDSLAALKSLANEFHTEMSTLLKMAQSEENQASQTTKEAG